MSSNDQYSPTIWNFLGLCVQGDLIAAYEYLSHQSNKTQQEEALVKQIHDRFFADEPVYQLESEDVWVKNVVLAYYRYFRAVLTKRASLNEGERILLAELRKFVTAENLEEAEDILKQEFTKRGYYFLGGKTLPFWGAYIWKTQESRHYDVDIPSGTEHLTVHFMRDFLLVSWLEFATMGLASTGGWAKEDGLYCVASQFPSLDDLKFVVSFLKHEAQHTADYRMFPDLSAKDLEYRAKLVELIYYPTKDKLMDFLRQANADEENAHAYAAYHIILRLSKRLHVSQAEFEPSKWDEISIDQLQKTAMQLLNDHTSQLLSGNTGI